MTVKTPLECKRICRQGFATEIKYYLITMKTRILKMADQPYLPPRMSDEGDDKQSGGKGIGTNIATQTRAKTKRPSMYRVLLLNDDYTPMEFVVAVLQRYFRMSTEEATQVMLHVHQKGVGICGVYTYEIAETKVNQTMDLAQQHQHPLQCTIEKD